MGKANEKGKYVVRKREGKIGGNWCRGGFFFSFLPPRVGCADADRVRGKYVLDREKL